VTVTDKHGQYVKGLTREAFSVSEGKSSPELAYFSAEESPQSVAVVFDVSGSIGRLDLDSARGALVRFMRQAHASNEYFILGFNNRTHLLADWTRDGKTIIEALNKLGHLKPDGTGTALYDALAAGVEKAARGSQPKRVVLLISDGQDNKSDVRRGKLRELIKRSDVLVYAVGVGVGRDDNALGYAGRAILKELTRPSGGEMFPAVTEGGMDDAFRRVALELHSQYTVGFKPAHADGKWHRFEVRVRPPQGWPSLKVRAREEYYAAPAPQSP
jgi:Ca-activated chloride channel homolog